MSNKQLTITSKVWVEDHAKLMAKENMRILNVIAKGKGKKVTETLIIKFLGEFIVELINTSLDTSKLDHLTEEQQYEAVAEKFMDMKANIQNEIAEGFRKALTKFTGKPVDYYVTVKPTPEPISKAVN